MRALIAASVLLLATSCAAPEPANGDTAADRAPASAPRTQQPEDGDRVGQVRAPVVVGDVPISSTDPEAIAALRSEPPQRLLIEALGLDMEVTDVGLADDGSMEIPEAAAVAGWYRFGPAPGADRGNAVLAAHVDDPKGVGPFAALKELGAGAPVQVVDAAGDIHAFVVDRVEQNDKREVDMSLVFDRDSPGQLVLVTCGGLFDWDTRHYEDNVVVYATPVENAP
ncbi:class F sortase [Demequina sp. NBRC 110053]|uniref:class F sortase n=1 Tax=Demequina sp. NBRC 110053 TaxID=1570342 RepID=UPI000A0011AF|nr:class F sortase [Demequina sp. NBRC 110053]